MTSLVIKNLMILDSTMAALAAHLYLDLSAVRVTGTIEMLRWKCCAICWEAFMDCYLYSLARLFGTSLISTKIKLKIENSMCVILCPASFHTHIHSPSEKGHDYYMRRKQPVGINRVINETELSDWHSWTLVRMPAMILMQYWYTSLWCSLLLHITLGSCMCCQTGSPDLLLISVYDFLQWHSHSKPEWGQKIDVAIEI